MSNAGRTIFRLTLLALVIWGASKIFLFSQIHFPSRYHPMIPELQDMQTFCVGNFLINLPRGSAPVRLETRLKGSRSSTLFAWPDTSLEDFKRKVATRWLEIKNLKNNGDTVFDQPSQRLEVLPDGVVLTSQHHTLNLKNWPGGGSGPKTFYETEGYLWREGTLYVFTSSMGKEGVINAMKAMQTRNDDEVSLGRGFCGSLSFFMGQAEPNDYVWFAYRLPVEPHTEFRIQVPTIRSPRPDLAHFESDKFKFKLLRKADQTLAGIKGEEWIEYDWQNELEGAFKTSVSASWFGAGKGEFGFPGIQLKLDSYSEAKNTQPPKVGEMISTEGIHSMTVDDLVALWDGIVATLRPRPDAF